MNEMELLILNSEIIKELKNRNVIRTKNSPIADYCEWLVAKKFNWKLENSSNGAMMPKIRVDNVCRLNVELLKAAKEQTNWV